MGPTYCNIILDNKFALQLEVIYDSVFDNCFIDNKIDYDKLKNFKHSYHGYGFTNKQVEEIKSVLDNLEYSTIEKTNDFAIDYSNVIPIFAISRGSISNIKQYCELLTKYNKKSYFILGLSASGAYHDLMNKIDVIIKLQETIKEKFEVVDKLKIAKYLMEEYKKISLLL